MQGKTHQALIITMVTSVTISVMNGSQRTLDTSLPLMKEVDMEDCPSIRTARVKQTGFTRLSILHWLNALYGFDVVRDLVFDAMHNVPLNVASHHLHYYFNEWLLTINDVDRCLKTIQWTPGS